MYVYFVPILYVLGHKKEWTFFRGGETNSSSFILYTQIQKSKSIYVSELLRDERRPPQWCACTVTTAFKNSNMNIYIYLLVWFKNNQGVNADLRKISVESDMRKNHDIYLIEAVWEYWTSVAKNIFTIHFQNSNRSQ